MIGKEPSGAPNNLPPYMSQLALGKLQALKAFGDDYDTPYDTGVKDYIHVVDLAQAHIAASEHIGQKDTHKVYKIGSG